jgi:hypothetical protein
MFATGWTTAWAMLGVHSAGSRCYFVQDFEPSFYPAGSDYMLAEATYGFRFHAVTAGRWLADVLATSYGMDAQYFDFGTDLDCYRLDPAVPRNGVSYYCRPATPRRAHELAIAGLDLFASANPAVPIHIFGQPAGKLPFEAIDHGLLNPSALNNLYNRSTAGLVLSATNASLVPHEMLAAGCIPVVNDAVHNRMVIDNDQVAYCEPVPHAIADRLAQIVRRPESATSAAALAASRSVEPSGWKRGEQQFLDAVERIVQVDAAAA